MRKDVCPETYFDYMKMHGNIIAVHCQLQKLSLDFKTFPLNFTHFENCHIKSLKA